MHYVESDPQSNERDGSTSFHNARPRRPSPRNLSQYFPPNSAVLRCVAPHRTSVNMENDPARLAGLVPWRLPLLR